MLEECISDHGHERMTMKTMPRPSLEVVEPELLLQLLVNLLTDPSRLASPQGVRRWRAADLADN